MFNKWLSDLFSYQMNSEIFQEWCKLFQIFFTILKKRKLKNTKYYEFEVWHFSDDWVSRLRKWYFQNRKNVQTYSEKLTKKKSFICSIIGEWFFYQFVNTFLALLLCTINMFNNFDMVDFFLFCFLTEEAMFSWKKIFEILVPEYSE